MKNAVGTNPIHVLPAGGSSRASWGKVARPRSSGNSSGWLCGRSRLQDGDPWGRRPAEEEEESRYLRFGAVRRKPSQQAQELDKDSGAASCNCQVHEQVHVIAKNPNAMLLWRGLLGSSSLERRRCLRRDCPGRGLVGSAQWVPVRWLPVSLVVRDDRGEDDAPDKT